MKLLKICLSLVENYNTVYTDKLLEEKYQSIYKPLCSYLYQHSKLCMSFAFSGKKIEWFNEKHSELSTVLHKMTKRKQIEFISGGYYNPVFPLLAPVDRTDQMELLNSLIKNTYGKRPRGVNIINSVWDNSLISGLRTCFMDYIQLDSSLIPPDSRYYLPQIVYDQGRNINVFPVYKEYVPDGSVSPDEYLSTLFSKIYEATQNDKYEYTVDERVVSINIEEELFEELIKSGWMESLFEVAKEKFSTLISFTLPGEVLRTTQDMVASFIPAGMQRDVGVWGLKPYEKATRDSGYPVTIHDFLTTYPRFHALYDRSLYISMLISQCRGDKSRQNAAKEHLWKAQDGRCYTCTSDGVFADNKIRQNAYKHLTEAEKIVREASVFNESVTSFDYNYDGHDEYLCQMKAYNACISTKAGSVIEFDVMHNTGNYVDNLSRLKKLDGCDDGYTRGLFVEHLFSPEDYEVYKKGGCVNEGVFSKLRFKQQDFDGLRHEIKLRGTGEFSSMKLPVSLRKNYFVNSNGLMVQYILKNEGPISLKGCIVVELNFAQTDFVKEDNYIAECITLGEKRLTGFNFDPVLVNNVSFVQITDKANDVSFVMEPNEDSDILFSRICFKRPVNKNGEIGDAGSTYVTSLCWNVDLSAGMEMEKTINFSVVIPKKRKTIR